MHSKKIIVIASVCALAAVLLLIWLLGDRKTGDGTRTPGAPGVGIVSVAGGGAKSAGASAPEGADAGLEYPDAALAREFLERWDELSLEKGPESLAARRALADEALATLRGAGLLAFAEGLDERRESAEAERIAEAGGKAMFAGKAAAGARERLFRMPSGKLKEKLCFQAGYWFAGPGLAEYLARLSPAPAQDRFLTGYACGLAEADGFRAMREFAALKPPKVTNYGMIEIMERLPENTDFAKMDTLYPDDGKSLAKLIRTAMLERWASFRPEEAAAFVLARPERIHPDQMAAVAAVWARKAPGAAGEWLEKAPAGPARDDGLAALAKHWTEAGRPGKAWRFAAMVADGRKRVAAAGEVYKRWAEKDPEAALKAWREMFPSSE